VTPSPWEWPTRSTRWHPLLRVGLRRLKPPGVRIAGKQTDFLIVDDTRHPRTGQGLEGVGYPGDPVQQRACGSHSLVLGVFRTGDYSFGYSCDASVRKKELEPLSAARQRENLLREPSQRRPSWEFHSKGDLMAGRPRAFRPLREGRQTFALFDSWYFNEGVVKAAGEANLDGCAPCGRTGA